VLTLVDGRRVLLTGASGGIWLGGLLLAALILYARLDESLRGC
jgi:hypothetical protein